MGCESRWSLSRLLVCDIEIRKGRHIEFLFQTPRLNPSLRRPGFDSISETIRNYLVEVIVEFPSHLQVGPNLLVLEIRAVELLQHLFAISMTLAIDETFLRLKLPVCALKKRQEIFLLLRFFFDGFKFGLVQLVQSLFEKLFKMNRLQGRRSIRPF